MTATTSLRVSTRFPAGGPTVAAARRFVRDTLRAWGAEAVAEEAVLLVSELVTNAVVHAGTEVEVGCRREDDQLVVDVVDRYPDRPLPAAPAAVSADAEGGRGLLLAGQLAAAWGISYERTVKRVWFRLALNELTAETAAGTTAASPLAAAAPLPTTDDEVRVAVLRTTPDGRILQWDAAAQALFGWTASQVRGRPLGELVTLGGGEDSPVTLSEVLALARWQGEYAVRHAGGGSVAAFASHVATTTRGGEPSVVCLLVPAASRSVLAAPVRAALPDTEPALPDDIAPSEAVAARLGLDDLLQQTVLRAREVLRGDAAYVLLARDGPDELELRAAVGLPEALPRHRRVPAGTGVAGRLSSAALPLVYDDLRPTGDEVPLLAGSGTRSLVSVPLLVEGRPIGTLAVASRRPAAFGNDEALALQRAADRIALAVHVAALAENEQARRGWLSFLAEASELLAGTLQPQMTLALLGQLVVPRLAQWCAVHLCDDTGTAQLSSVWHADEDQTDGLRGVLAKVPPPEPAAGSLPTPWHLDEGTATALRGLPGTAALTDGELVATALVARGRRLGTLALGRPAGDPFPREVLELAEDLTRRAALAVDNARLYSLRQAESQALQRSLLPHELPEIPGMEVKVAYEATGAGNEVGGDFYDVLAAGPGRWRFAIGDVCGKGPEAAAVTGLARHVLRTLARKGDGITEALAQLNTAILAEGSRARFLTLVYGELRVGGPVPRVSLACAGHPPPLLVPVAGPVTPVGPTGTLLGVLPELDVATGEVDLPPGACLVLYTDGVTERRDGPRMLGEDGLRRLLAGCAGLGAGAVAARIAETVAEFAGEPPRDDLAVLVLRTLP